MNQSMRFKLWPLFARSVLMAACVAPAMGHAEDIDLFLKPSAEKVRPNVLLLLDNSADNSSNMVLLDGVTKSDKLTMMRQVLDVVMNPKTSTYFPKCTVTPATRNEEGEILTEATRVPEGCTTTDEADALISSVNMGLMLLNPSTATNGAYVRYHVRPMDVPANRKALLDKVSPGIPKSNNSPIATMMHEAYRYFSGGKFYAGFSSKNNLDDPAAKQANGTHYNSPLSLQCQASYLIFLGAGEPDAAEEGPTKALLRDELKGVLTGDPIALTPDNLQSSWFDEYARTLNRTDLSSSIAGSQNITTYTIAIQDLNANNADVNKLQGARALLQSAAEKGGGAYAVGSNGAALLKALFDSLRQMQPANSVFAAVTLPVSVNVRGTFLNQVYMGQFRPDENAKPRWPGNLKQYQIILNSSGNPILSDRNGDAVEDTVNGFLLPDKTSFWSSTSSDWSFIQGVNASDAPDGSVVEKGGAGQKMRNDFNTAAKRGNRKIYTCNGKCVSGNDLSLINFNTDNNNASGPSIGNLKVADAAERIALIEWVRGADNKDDEDGDGDLTDNRAYIHGDLLHSRPAVINYNRVIGNNDVMVYYGANDGIFHAVKGGQGDDDGVEKWGMVFPEFFGKLKSLRDNDTVISPSSPKPYFADGSVSVYQNDLNDNKKIDSGDKAYIYIGMRRGGEFAHALDVTDPEAPKYLWRISPDISVKGVKVFKSLGQTWSTLRPATIKALTTGPVVIMGGGYDNASEDKVPATANTRGKGIYVINGETGALISHIVSDAMGSIPADLTVLDRDGDGKADRIYAPDTKGNVWRADIDDADPANWKLHHIAALGGTGGDGRKFLNKIDVVYGSTFDALLVGSGDREHPDNMSITDRFYMLMDTKIGKNAGGKFCGPSELPVTCTHEHLADVTLNPYQNGTLPTDKKGWYLTFEAGEKVVNSPVTVFGTVIFGTNTPTESDPGICGNLGKAKLYQIGYKTGNAVNDLNGDGIIDASDRSEEVEGGGFLPSGVYSPVTIDGERIEVVCVGTRCFKPEGGKYGPTRHRTYWYRKQ